MEVVAEKIDGNNDGAGDGVPRGILESDGNGVAESREHKAGLHPLKVLALVGDQLDFGEDICGAVLSIRFDEAISSVWNRNASDHQSVMALRDSIKRHLKLPHSYVMEYKPHNASLRDNSSYRNTWLRG